MYDKKFSILNVNIRSMRSNFLGLMKLLGNLSTRPMVIVVTETWLKDTNVNLYNIPGYNKICANRPTTGGGIILYYSQIFTGANIAKLSGIFPTYRSLGVNIISI